MKASPSCHPCLARLARQASELSTGDPGVAARAAEVALAVLNRDFSLDKVTIVIASGIHAAVREISGNPDPYRTMKERERAISRDAYPRVRPHYGTDLISLVKLAAIGNTIDFFRAPEVIVADLQRPVRFQVDETGALKRRLPDAHHILYLADNAGEIMFDLPLVEFMRQSARVTYVVKAGPVQDDLTPADVEASGLRERVGEMMTTGTATPGALLEDASKEFKDAFAGADLIFAKGMGYWETLSELPQDGRVFHCLMAKCQPVADSLDVPLGAFVARFRQVASAFVD